MQIEFIIFLRMELVLAMISFEKRKRKEIEESFLFLEKSPLIRKRWSCQYKKVNKETLKKLEKRKAVSDAKFERSTSEKTFSFVSLQQQIRKLFLSPMFFFDTMKSMHKKEHIKYHD